MTFQNDCSDTLKEAERVYKLATDMEHQEDFEDFDGYIEKIKEAIDKFEKALAINPENKDAWIKLGDAYSKLSFGEDLSDIESSQTHKLKSIECYLNSLNLDKEDFKVYERLGKAFYEFADFPNIPGERYLLKSIQSYEKYLLKYPSDTDVLRSLALVLNTIGRYKEAKKCYDNALELDPDDAGLMRMAAGNLRDMGKYKDALKLLEKCLILYNQKHHIWRDMAHVYEKMAEDICKKSGLVSLPLHTWHNKWKEIKPYYEKVIEYMEKASEELPTSWGILQELERYHAFIGNYEKAIEYKEKARKCKEARKT